MTLLLCDVDGVLADFVGGVLKVLSERCDRSHTHADVDQYNIKKALELTDDEWRTCVQGICEPGFAGSLDTLPGAFELVQALRDPSLEVHFVTAPWWSSPTWCYDRVEWLCRFFGQKQGRRVSLTYEKQHHAGDLFVDDHPDAVARWVEASAERTPRGVACLWDAPHNQGVEGPRVKTFAEALELTR